ncbi:hypothetical protein CDAR_294291 [Caerostris darwini]|uniref:Globin family profile domain-containing protein n=1 Tax=Caerostris darwini TaxID=1538125 RepID=A0AAV4R158_9ARAC|nr:hypothetical protein CDAR_294291 [Caerostris darwini]
MGCKHSKSTGEKPENVNPVIEQVDTPMDNSYILEESKPVISERQKELILETWKMLVENISNVGVITFMNFKKYDNKLYLMCGFFQNAN